MKKWIAILLLCLPTISLAATTQVNASWTRPTQRTDASALSTSEIKLYKVRIYDGSCTPETPADCDGTAITFTGWFPGGTTEQIYLRALGNYVSGQWMTVDVTVIDTDDQESTPVSFRFDVNEVVDNSPADPDPITELIIEILT